MNRRVSRREVLIQSGVAGAALAAPKRAGASRRREPFRFSLNTSTIMGQKVPLVQEIEIASKAGYDAIEPWISELDTYVKEGGTLPDLRKRLSDHGLSVESAIGFFDWIVDDEAERRKALEEARRNMDMLAQIGAKRIAAPPSGGTERTDLNLHRAAERYRALLDLGDQFGVIPQVEVWGFSKTLQTLGEAALVAIESRHAGACILADVYHLYKGGSEFTGLKLLSGNALHVLHMNDYPSSPPRDKITDADRVYPGDGVAPLRSILRDLREIGFNGVLSVELFNREYWKQDALTVARTALQKTKAAVQQSASAG